MGLSAIIDNSALRALYLVNQLSLLHLLYEEVLVPRVVEKEFLSVSDLTEQQERFDFLIPFYETNSSWFLRCNQYDQALMAIYLTSPKMDAGEAEVLSQNQCLGAVHQVIIDEKVGRQFAQSKTFNCCGTLSILARLDLQFNQIDYMATVQKLINNHSARYSKTVINNVFADIKKQLGIV